MKIIISSGFAYENLNSDCDALQIACYIIGPRKGRFNSDGTVNEMPGHSVPLAALGGSLLLVCFLAFNGGSQVMSLSEGTLGCRAV